MSTADDDVIPGALARVYTVAPGEPFLDRLAAAILNGDLPAAGSAKPHPLELPDITILLPTRRATRALQEAFLRVSGSSALLLPQMRPIAEGDDELSLITGIVNREMIAGPDDSMPLPISELQRRLALTELVMRWSQAMRGGGEGAGRRGGVGGGVEAGWRGWRRGDDGGGDIVVAVMLWR